MTACIAAQKFLTQGFGNVDMLADFLISLFCKQPPSHLSTRLAAILPISQILKQQIQHTMQNTSAGTPAALVRSLLAHLK